VGTRGGGGFERRLIESAAIQFEAYEEVFAGPLVGVNLLRALSSVVKIAVGVMQSIALLLRHKPHALLLTGGWANVPLALAAWLWQTPMLVYLPDIEPGQTIRILAKFAQKMGTTVPEAAAHFREGQTVVTGYPLREAVTSATREAAMQHFGLDSAHKTLLVTGGSRGARSINIAIEQILPDLLACNLQILHVTGKLDWERSQQQLVAFVNNAQYHAFEYLDSVEMGLAFAAADIIVGRSGASALGEFPYFGAASILIPYPYVWRYQKINADWLVQRGAAMRIDDEKMSIELLPAIRDLLHDETRLQAMQSCARALYSGNGADNLARELRALAGEVV